MSNAIMARKRIVEREEEAVSRQIRAYSDLADMLKWVVKLANTDREKDSPQVTMAGWIDPLLRPQIETAFRRIIDRVNTIKDAEGTEDSSPREMPGGRR